MSTTRCLAAALTAVLFCFATGCAPRDAQSSLWQTYNDSGKQAYEGGEYAKAQKLYESAIKEAEGFRPSDPRLGTSLNNLAALYKAQGRYDQAEPLYRRSLAIREKVLGPNHTDVALSLNNLASLYQDQAKYEQAAAALLCKLGGTAEIARHLAYRLYTVCERKKWADEALAYNGLVIAWPELTKLAMAAPKSRTETQAEMF